MSLWDHAKDRSTSEDPALALKASHEFVLRCQDWARRVELPKLRARLERGDDPADAAKLHQWLTWLAFTEHARQELESGALDGWFEAVNASKDG